MAELFIGLMSGTSADAIDAALVSFDPSPRVLCANSIDLPADLRQRIRSISANTSFTQVSALDVEVAERFAQAVLSLLEQAAVGADEIKAIGSHGQTVWHQPAGKARFTLQIGDPNIISERTGITTVADFRRRDMAAGGQGAPLVPAFHSEVVRSPDENRCILNLGGIANITLLPKQHDRPVHGFDTGPANTLLDAWTARHLQQSYDRDGAWAARGQCRTDLLARLLADAYFLQPAPKSTGPEYFSLDWLDRKLLGLPEMAAEDVQATLVELTARTVARAISETAPETERVLVCGGGARNPVLMSALREQLGPATVESTAAHGIDPDFVEACAFAWLARQTLSGRPGNLTEVTGASRPAVLGAIFPGAKGL